MRKTLKNMKWGTLIKETHDNIIDSVGWFIEYALIAEQNYRKYVEDN